MSVDVRLSNAKRRAEKPSSEVLARKAGIFKSRVDLARGYVGGETLPEGVWSVEE